MQATTEAPIFAVEAALPRGPHGLAPEEVVRSQRMRVLAAVAELVGERGYAETTVAALVREAGVSRATFYDLFADKEASFLAAYDHFVETLIERMALRIEPAEDFEAFVDAALGAYLSTLDANPRAARAMLVEMQFAGRAARARTVAAYRGFAALMAAQHAAQRRRDPTLGELNEIVFVGLAHGVRDVVQMELEAGTARPLTELAPDLRHWILATIRGAAAV